MRTGGVSNIQNAGEIGWSDITVWPAPKYTVPCCPTGSTGTFFPPSSFDANFTSWSVMR